MNEPEIKSAPANDEVDVSKIDRATLQQLRKNIEKLKRMDQMDKLRKTSHFNLGQLFPALGSRIINKDSKAGG